MEISVSTPRPFLVVFCLPICTVQEGMESWNRSADARKELIGIKTDYEQEIDHGDTYYFSSVKCKYTKRQQTYTHGQ